MNEILEITDEERAGAVQCTDDLRADLETAELTLRGLPEWAAVPADTALLALRLAVRLLAQTVGGDECGDKTWRIDTLQTALSAGTETARLISETPWSDR